MHCFGGELPIFLSPLIFSPVPQIAHPERMLGVCLMHCTGTTAGFLESLKDKVCIPVVLAA